jgi:BlaI family transcriptional regulator, penicillinase repressor
MARSPSNQPTEGELEILKLLWDSEPQELGQICAALREQRPVATTTVATMLKVMMNKGLARRTKGKRGWVWTAKASREATTGNMLTKLIDRVFDGSAQLLVTQLLEQGKLSDEDRRQIRALLERGRPPGS